MEEIDMFIFSIWSQSEKKLEVFTDTNDQKVRSNVETYFAEVKGWVVIVIELLLVVQTNSHASTNFDMNAGVDTCPPNFMQAQIKWKCYKASSVTNWWQYIWCVPTATKCVPESAKSIAFSSFYMFFYSKIFKMVNRKCVLLVWHHY